MVSYSDLSAAAEFIKNRIECVPETAVVLGSGLGGFADTIENPAYVSYDDIPGFPRSTVRGHAGRFVCGRLDGRRVLVMQGRVHYYEGYDMSQVVMPIRTMGLLGVRNLILTNASGGISGELEPGDIMAISDHISFLVPSPLIYQEYDKLGDRFPDMTHVYDEELIVLIRECYDELKLDFRCGVYAQTSGPQYETPAEVRLLGVLGADAVGMSTACEAIAARHMGMRVAGLSAICNKAAGLSDKLSHEDILKAGALSADKLCGIIRQLLKKI